MHKEIGLSKVLIRTGITKTFLGAIPEPGYIFWVTVIFVLSSYMVSLTNKNTVDVDHTVGFWNSSMGGFGDIGAHQYLGQADLFIPD